MMAWRLEGRSMPVAEKEFLTVQEFAFEVRKTYGTIRNWILQKRVKAVGRTVKGRTYSRIPVQEAERVKKEIERGAWI